MFKNYVKVAVRNFLKYKGYSFINIAGLAIGIACCLLILLYVQDELSYDRYHDKDDRIYRILLEYTHRGRTSKQVATPSAVAPLFARNFPEVEQAVRFYPPWRAAVISYDEKAFTEDRFYFADANAFEVFSWPFVFGDPKTALDRPNTLVLTQATAKKYFGDENPVGRKIKRDATWEFEVTGVIEDVPENSHFRFDFLASYTSLTNSWAVEEVWHSANLMTYLLLTNRGAISTLQGKIIPLLEQQRGDDAPKIHFEPLRDIHLHSAYAAIGETNGDIANVYAFSGIAILILLIACVNYMNLATARATQRSREVGIRKVLGAFRSRLRSQFFGEAALTTALAILLTVLLMELLLPVFNRISGKQLVIDYSSNPFILTGLLAICLLVSFVAGSYPALLMSAFQPITALARTPGRKNLGSSFRNKLVVFQFIVSVTLIVATLVVKNQLDYVRNKKLGFDKEQVMVLSISDEKLRESYRTLKGELTQHTSILDASAVSGYPGNQRAGYSAAAEGLREEEYPLTGGMIADERIVQTLGLDLVAGRGFPESHVPRQGYLYVINSTLLKELGWTADEAVGKWIDLRSNRKGTIVGVVEDFHFASLHSTIAPLAIFTSPHLNDYSYLLVKLDLANLSDTIAFMRQKWQAFAPDRPFEYAFLDQEFDALYRSESRVGQIFMGFAVLAIFIACLGLFGLASFTAERRTKEIGIRKVLGASATEILVLLSKDFTKLVFVAFIIAIPLAYFPMQSWLENFAYRIDIDVLIFIFAGGLAIAIALLTVAYQALKAAAANPVDALRYE